MSALQQAGHFQAKPIDYSMKEVESGAVSINIKWQILARWTGEAWEDWSEYEPQEIFSDSWVIKKDGQLNQEAAKSLAQACGPWDFGQIIDRLWHPTNASISVGTEEYKGKTQFKVKWLNPFDHQPGVMQSNVDPNRKQEFTGRFGPQLRALFGNMQRNGNAPAGQPSLPQPPTLDEVLASGKVPEGETCPF